MKTLMNTWNASPATAITLRVVIAVAGGYAASTAISLLFAAMNEMSDRQEVAFIRMVFFLVYTVYIIWIFAINDLQKVLVTGLATNAVAWALVWSGVFS